MMVVVGNGPKRDDNSDNGRIRPWSNIYSHFAGGINILFSLSFFVFASGSRELTIVFFFLLEY